MTIKNSLLVVILGPTAIGKTSTSIELAKHFNSEIISADSRQFFKEMQIGTAVPSVKELNEVPHHFIQNKSIKEPYSVGDFEREALQKLDLLFKENDIVFMVGGSGLYIDAVLYGLDHFPVVPESIRKKLVEELQTNGLKPLQKELEEKDPIYFKEVDLDNTQRVIRALEVCRASGLPFSSFRKKNKVQRNFTTCLIGLEAPRQIVYDRINKRIDKMMEEGLLEEVKQLMPYKSYNALNTVGYKELFAYFEEKHSLENAILEIKKNTRRFSKRQGTWFRKNKDIVWFPYQTTTKELVDFIKKTQA